MGNLHPSPSQAAAGGKVVVLSDGTVHKFDRPIPVAELMLEHPHQFVVEVHLSSFSTAGAGGSNKVTPLPADHTLEPEKLYAMLPMARKKAAATLLSAREVRQILLSLARPAPGGSAALLPNVAGEESGQAGRVELPESDLFDGRPENWGGKYWSKGWKPSLRTIEEVQLIKRIPHWLF
ncbi:hypothetical protein Cni_G04792 [Canna indica]|uniref:Uncharacterized protein n=1 Tax=Canna indica TaxID=4628 RepID=A0AAQ3Q4B1_9LILI|nr:hypothetical protein Cni_G04792 [Canna indica]